MPDTILNYAEIIKKTRKEFKMTQEELGKKIGSGKTAVSNYEIGYSTPSASVLEKIASAFEMSIIELLSKDKVFNEESMSQPRFGQAVSGLQIPYLKASSINTRILECDNYCDYQINVPGFMLRAREGYFCIKMHDNSMETEGIRKNDFVLIKKCKNIEPGKIVLAIHNVTGNYMIRKYFKEGHIITFVPATLSMGYSIISTNDTDKEFEIIGYVEKALINVK